MRFSKLSVGLAVVFVLAAVQAGTAGTFFFSTSATSPTDVKPDATPAGTNPTIAVAPGTVFNVYIWWDPDTQAGSSSPNNLVFNGLGLDIEADIQAIVVLDNASTTTDFTVDNPTIAGATRWNSIGKGTTGTLDAAPAPTGNLLVNNSNSVKLGGNNFGSAGANDPFYDATTDTYRFGFITLEAVGSAGATTGVFFGVGSNGMTFQAPNAAGTTINFGWGTSVTDPAVAGNSAARTADDATSLLADLTISIVPEPSTFVLLGMGLIGLVAIRRKRG